MVKKLRDELKCELVVAVSHMTLVNDRKLAEEVLGIDIIFGGHDHLLVHEKIR
jgi:2',3'-cyclic-nucleotide 2'-phosphodiesterase (5'-nucleotidase family)